MQATPDGEFYPDKELDKNFRIPKKTPKNSDASSSKTRSPLDRTNTPLANSYYNYPYDPSVASAYYGNNSHYYQQYGHDGVFSQPPLPPPGVEPIEQNIFKALKDIKEKPKNYQKNIFQSTVPDVLDESLPKDLRTLFQPLFCKLCTAQLSSNIMARNHYKSKKHEKKVKSWLIDYCKKTGEPLPTRAIVPNEKQPEQADKNPAWFHCDVCDLELTGKLHAESHYMGKNHQRAMLGHKLPTGPGYYDNNGKWVRLKGQKKRSYDFERGEDNFGFTFKQPENSIQPPTKKKKTDQSSSKFHCDVCDINTTCQEQLDGHLKGQKHMKKLKVLGLNRCTKQRDIVEYLGNVSGSPVIPDAVAPDQMDLAVYRTPSGSFYCPTCNITANSEVPFVQHMKSKNHLKKAAQSKYGGN